MISHSGTSAGSYEVALAGSIGPAFSAALATAGMHRSLTTSLFLLPASSGADLCEVVGMLEAQGLTVLNVRRVPERGAPHVEEPRDALTSSPQGDASQRHRE